MSTRVTGTNAEIRDAKSSIGIIQAQNISLKEDTTNILSELTSIQQKLDNSLYINDKAHGAKLRGFLSSVAKSVMGSDESCGEKDCDETALSRYLLNKDELIRDVAVAKSTDSISGSAIEDENPSDISQAGGSAVMALANLRVTGAVSAGQWSRTRASDAEKKRLDLLVFKFASRAKCPAKLLESLLVNGADVNCRGKMTYSLGKSQPDSSNRSSASLIGTEANNSAYETEGSLLMILCVQRNTEGVELVLDWGADLNQLTSDGRTVMQIAAALGNAEILQMLLIKGGASTISKGTAGDIPPILAIENANWECLQLLLDFRRQDECWDSTLMSAVKQKGRYLELILENPTCVTAKKQAVEYLSSVIWAAEER